MTNANASSARGSALLLIAGALFGVLSMVLHPTSGLTHSADAAVDLHYAYLAALIHAGAVTSLVLQTAGGLALHRRLHHAPARADLGLAALVLGLTFAILAATANGLAAPKLLALTRPGAENHEAFAAVWRVLHELADVATVVFLVGTALSALLWGAALVKRSRPTGLLGVLVGVVGLVATAGGAFRPEVHPLLAFVALWEAWIVAAALWLWRQSSAPPRWGVPGSSARVDPEAPVAQLDRAPDF